MPHHVFSSDNCKRLLTLDLPSLESLQGVDLDIGTAEVRLLLPGTSQHLEIPLPTELAGNFSVPSAKFSRKRRQLIVTWELDANPADTSPVDRTDAAQELASDICPAATCNSSLRAEESDCLELLQDEVEHVLKQCTVKRLKSVAAINGSSILLSDFNVKGSAKIVNDCCKIAASILFKWEVMDAFGGLLGSSGTGEVAEFTHEQTSAKVTIKSARGGSSQARAASEWMKQCGANLVGECLNGEEISATVVSDWKETVSEAALETPGTKVPLMQWAQTWLEEKFANLTVKLFGGSACTHFKKPDISGEVSTTLQDGRNVVVFHLRLECAWAMTTSTGTLEGTLLLPEFKSGQGIESTTIQIDAAQGKKASGQLLTALRQTGVSAVRTLLDRFTHELHLQI